MPGRNARPPTTVLKGKDHVKEKKRMWERKLITAAKSVLLLPRDLATIGSMGALLWCSPNTSRHSVPKQARVLVEGSASRHYRHAIVLAVVTQAHQRPAKAAHDVEAVPRALLAQDSAQVDLYPVPRERDSWLALPNARSRRRARQAQRLHFLQLQRMHPGPGLGSRVSPLHCVGTGERHMPSEAILAFMNWLRGETSRPTSESSSKEINLGCKHSQTWTRPDLDLT